jgi:response regulator RpfG family c-di-GMP phosphodiesterase
MQIVIVDDNRVNVALLKVLARQLTDQPAAEFTDPVVALDWCLTHAFDLLLVDYMMPDLDGLTFVARLRAQADKADVPVLMVTASHESEVRYQALGSGATDFLTKPIDRIEFLARSRNMLALRRSQKALADRATWLAEEVAKATQALVEREHDTILRLSRAAEYRDPETGLHLARMARYSQLIGRNLGLDTEAQQTLLRAAPMHDIGKVGIPDAILLKPGKLDAAEWAVMREHSAIGHQILRDSPSPMLQMAAVIAYSHHERFDGHGYPQGLAGTDIPLVGRIVAVADVLDALTSRRPYKPAWSFDAALALLREQSGTQFDPACVAALEESWSEVLAIHAEYHDGDGQEEGCHALAAT